ncbi:uncharacterized protein LOC117643009 [Thrips palmi]|uniref:Uncharacterized protein LOC117643009 n=1 Tax=Thrips palmi TaxID=161013 RepID=A0A6P8YL75_THRPL|nr:uncharacterized protein LOC117643009 [Thrips palmi]
MRILVLLVSVACVSGVSLVAAAPGALPPPVAAPAPTSGDYGLPYGVPQTAGFGPQPQDNLAPPASLHRGHHYAPLDQVSMGSEHVDHAGPLDAGGSAHDGSLAGPQGPLYQPQGPGQWKKKLTWKAEQKQEWKTVPKVVRGKPEWKQVQVEHCEPTQVQVWKDVQVPEWKSVKKPVWKDVHVQAWKQTLVPEWKTIKIPEWKEIEMPAWKDEMVQEDKKVWVPEWSEEWVPDAASPHGGNWKKKMIWKQIWQKEWRTEKKRIWVKEKRPVWREESLKINKVESKQLVWVPDKKMEWRDEMVQGWRTEQRPIWVQEKRCEWRDQWKQVIPNTVVDEQVPEWRTVWRPVWESVWEPGPPGADAAAATVDPVVAAVPGPGLGGLPALQGGPHAEPPGPLPVSAATHTPHTPHTGHGWAGGR